MTQTEAFLLTLAIEVPVAVGLVAWRRWAPGRPPVVAATAVAASAATHPIFWLVDPLLFDLLGAPLRWALLETTITLVEAAVYRLGAGLPSRRALVTSFVANAASFGVGLLIYAISSPT